jgi:hypothetical protein
MILIWCLEAEGVFFCERVLNFFYGRRCYFGFFFLSKNLAQ